MGLNSCKDTHQINEFISSASEIPLSYGWPLPYLLAQRVGGHWHFIVAQLLQEKLQKSISAEIVMSLLVPSAI